MKPKGGLTEEMIKCHEVIRGFVQIDNKHHVHTERLKNTVRTVCGIDEPFGP